MLVHARMALNPLICKETFYFFSPVHLTFTPWMLTCLIQDVNFFTSAKLVVKLGQVSAAQLKYFINKLAYILCSTEKILTQFVPSYLTEEQKLRKVW